MFQIKYLNEFGSEFSPLDLSPVLWLDASATSTITESGGAVSQWDDLSGNGNHVVQGTAANQPTSGTRTINGLNVLDFDGGDNLVGSFSSITVRTIFGVAQSDQTSTTAYWFDGNDGSTNRSSVGVTSLNQYRIYGGIGVNGSGANTSAHVWKAVFDVTDTLEIDGVQRISGNAGSHSIAGTNIGSFPNLNSGWNGTVGEVILVDGTLTSDQITATWQYLADKWGITL